MKAFTSITALLLLCLCFATPVFSQIAPPKVNTKKLANIPEEIKRTFGTRFSIPEQLKFFKLSADFNDDKELDDLYIVQVEENGSIISDVIPEDPWSQGQNLADQQQLALAIHHKSSKTNKAKKFIIHHFDFFSSPGWQLPEPIENNLNIIEKTSEDYPAIKAMIPTLVSEAIAMTDVTGNIIYLYFNGTGYALFTAPQTPSTSNEPQ